MNKQKTSIGIFAFLTIFSAYFLTGEADTYSVVSEDSNGKLNSKTLNIESDKTSTFVDTSKLNVNDSTAHKAEFSNIPARHYSHTFSTTEEYETASKFGKLPIHMSDVRIEELAFDANNSLIVDESIKNLIEFFLLAKDIEGQEQTIQRLREYLELTLPSPAKEQALALSEQYLNYKENHQTQQFSDNTNLSDEANLSDIKIALEERKKARRQYLGDANSQAIFGYEEKYDDFSFKRLEINANTSLSANEKDELIALAEQQLPNELAEKMRYKRQKKNIEKQISLLKKDPTNESEIYNLRKDFYGEKAAERMAYLEDNSAEWQQRVNGFYYQQSLILNNSDLDKETKNELVKQLKEQNFSYKEQVKLAVQSIRS
jgi:lipase chaperone LimK